jgi:hypothetical protein
MKINAAFANPSNLNALLDCNYETFKAVVQNDNLDVNNEKIVCDLVLEYIAQRRKIAEEMKEQMQARAEDEMKKQQEEQAMKQVGEDKPQQPIQRPTTYTGDRGTLPAERPLAT